MSFGSRLKERREALNITQPQLAEMLGVSKGAIGNWETDVNSPRATLLYNLFDILHCDANYLFQDEMKDLKYKNKATPEEFETIIKKYRDLDPHGKKMVDFTLNEEYKRVQSEKVIKYDYSIPAAAHERTDTKVTEEARLEDDAIMHNDSEWE